ncbi:molybdate ABC transporter substrate-binding protein [Terribacillus sp. 179-K 1B1 HS]|uniref:molybdate ABC transporter substrate-binding protein n=1 Tax=Terribacillus sp. 179-K 1B1 HS TaxID=3142388 RepID=UPI0039A34AB7
MKIRKLISMLVLVLLLVSTGCSHAAGTAEMKQETELTISAAASLQDSLEEIKQLYESRHPDVKLQFNFGGSGSLQQQISKGAPVDLFFSAAADNFNKLKDEGMMDETHAADLLGNDLVLVVLKDEKGFTEMADVQGADTLAMGTVETVPAGAYAKETLTNMQLWKTMEPHIVYTKDVRQVLQYVETGNADAGMVYKTDALTSSKVRIAAVAPSDTHESIVYPVGVLKDSTHKEAAVAFYDFLQTEEALQVFEDDGFTIN